MPCIILLVDIYFCADLGSYLNIWISFLFQRAMLSFDRKNPSVCSTLPIWFLFLFQRAMPSGFFVLQRFFLRVDSTLIRVYDTRLYHDVTKSYLLREYSERESRTQDLNLPAEIFTQENEIVQHLKVVKEITEKLNFPAE